RLASPLCSWSESSSSDELLSLDRPSVTEIVSLTTPCIALMFDPLLADLLLLVDSLRLAVAANVRLVDLDWSVDLADCSLLDDDFGFLLWAEVEVGLLVALATAEGEHLIDGFVAADRLFG